MIKVPNSKNYRKNYRNNIDCKNKDNLEFFSKNQK